MRPISFRWLSLIFLIVIWVVALVLGMLVLRDRGITLDFSCIVSFLATNKDAIQAAASIISTLLLFVASVASYLRFLRGRILAMTANLSVSVKVLGAGPDANLHAIGLEVTNTGAVPIGEPTVSINALFHGPKESSDELLVKQWDSPTTQQPGVKLTIYPNETCQFHAIETVSKSIWAVSYIAVVRAGRVTWRQKETFSNREKTLQPEIPGQ